jgi:hypothetical protein
MFQECASFHQGDKSQLNFHNKKSNLRFPISSSKVSLPSEKASILIQSSIQNVILDSWQLKTDAVQAITLAQRVSSALLYFCIAADDMFFETVNAALTLAQCVHGEYVDHVFVDISVDTTVFSIFCFRTWEQNSLILKQLPGIGVTIGEALHKHGISKFAQLDSSTDQALATAAQRTVTWASNLKSSLYHVPQFIIETNFTRNRDGSV